jgi:hypothetical protein
VVFGSSTYWTLSIQPAIKRYLVLRESVSPYWMGALRGTYGWSEFGRSHLYSREATLSAGIGADWTPLRDVSIGASTGIEWTESISSRNDSGATKERLSDFNTVSTSLQLHLYF